MSKPHTVDIDKILGKINDSYKNTDHVDGMQHDPSKKTTTDFKQEYTVIIRKKKYYAITAGSNNNDEYTEIYQLNNFINLRTSINTKGHPGQCSITLAGNTKVVHATREQQEKEDWGSGEEGFYKMLNGWVENIEDNTSKLNFNGNILYKNILFDNIDDMKRMKYGWKIVEKCDFQPMDEVYVFAKSRKLKDEHGKYKMFQIFFGYISTINKTFSSDRNPPLVTIQADDHTKLLQISYLNNSPGMDYRSTLASASYNKDFAGNLIIDDGVSNGENVNMFTNVFAGRYPYEIILKCARDAGIPDKFLQKRIEKITRIPFMPTLKDKPIEVFQSDLKDRLGYCRTAAEKLFIEFFADEEGNLVLKIPNWTLGVNELLANNMYMDFSEEERNQMKNLIKSEEVIEQKTTVYETIIENLSKTITHTVIKGDNLWSLSKKYLGDSSKWTQIYELNKDKIKNPHWIYPGQVLYIKKGETITKKVPKDKIIQKKQVIKAESLSEITDEYIRVIEDNEIISFNLSNSDKQVVNCFEIQQEVPLVNAAMQQIPQASKRAIEDWASIIQFGFRMGKNYSTPLLDKDIGPVMFGSLMLQKSMAERYKGTLKMIEESSIRVGDPIRVFLYDEHPFTFKQDENNNNVYKTRQQAIFYVESIDRQIDVKGVSTMTLSLSAGRVMGMKSTYDNLSILYKKYYEEPKPVPINIEKNTSSSNFGNYNGSFETTEVQNKIVEYAKNFLGLDYVWSSADPSKLYYKRPKYNTVWNPPRRGFDCSGLTYYVYKKFGHTLPHNAAKQQKMGFSVSLNKLQPADLVFFGNPAHHVGLYIGNGQFIEAPQTNKKIKISNLSSRKPTNARRIIQPKAGGNYNKSGNVLAGGHKCVDVIKGAIVTCYSDVGNTASGVHCDASGKIAAAHGMPIGTKIYIPSLIHVNGTGIFDVQDTGGPFFDFDINTTKGLGKQARDVYILSWGKGRTLQTFQQAISEQKRLGQWTGPNKHYHKAYHDYYGKFKTEHKRY